MKLTIDQYSKKFKMSKEMIHSKIKTKEINSIIENNEVYILLENGTQEHKNQIVVQSKKPTVAMVIALYQKENQLLKDKIEKLEEKIDKLIDDKEKMLKAERDRIESIYIQKDIQLRNLLELINNQISDANTTSQIHEIHPHEIAHEIHKKEEEKEDLVELKKYLKTLNITSSKKKDIKKRFLKSYDDIRVIKKDEKLYLDFSKYDYGDLLKH